MHEVNFGALVKVCDITHRSAKWARRQGKDRLEGHSAEQHDYHKISRAKLCGEPK